MDSLLADFRFALRSFRRSPAFTIAAVVALGLGTGAAAAVFSLLEGVVLRPLPYAEPTRLVMLWDGNDAKALQHQPISPVNFMDDRALSRAFEDAAAWWRPEINLADDATGDPIRVAAVETSQNLFRVLGVRPFLGRDFPADTMLFGNEQQAIISHRLWRSRFGGDRGAIGRAVRMNGFLYTIVGVMPPGFDFPGETDVWQQLSWNLTQHSRGAHFMEGVARLKRGVTVDQANRELARLGTRLATEFRGTNTGWSTRAVSLGREVAGVFRPALFALLGATGLLLLIACLNVANLLLARATARTREVSLRAAIGASRSRLVRQFLTESVVLAALGALLGLAVAVGGVKALLAWTPIHIPRADGIAVNGAVLAFATLVTALTAIAFGLAPALLMSRAELQHALKDGARGAGAHGKSTRSVLVVAEVALAVVLLSGAGLLIRSVLYLLRENVGVSATSVLAADVQLPDAAYKEWPRVDQFYLSLLAALRARPEVVAAGAGNFLPLEPGWRLPFVVIGAAPVRQGDEPTAQFQTIDEGYLGTLRVPLIRGRGIEARDAADAPAVVVVNEALARQLWPGENAVGKRIGTRERAIGPLGARIVAGDEHEVVGVVGDVKNTSLRSAAEPTMYFAERQFPFRKMHVVVRGHGDPASLAAIVRDAVRRVDPQLPIANVKPLERVLAQSVDPPRFVMLLLGVFAAVALALAAVGIYGMLTYTVSHRRKEIGIRVALGARPADLVRMIVREGVMLAVVGCALGAAGAFVAGRSLGGLLYGVTPWDPVTLAGVLTLVLGVALAACALPGRRAAGEDPVRALRAD